MYPSIARGASRQLCLVNPHGLPAKRSFDTNASRKPWQRRAGQSNKRARYLFTRSKPRRKSSKAFIGLSSFVGFGGLVYVMNRNVHSPSFPSTELRRGIQEKKPNRHILDELKSNVPEHAQLVSTLPFNANTSASTEVDDDSAWVTFSSRLDALSSIITFEWGPVAEKLSDFMMPDWAKVLPGSISKLQKELSMAPGSLADEIWNEAHDSTINPEIEYSASVRVSAELCHEEMEFLRKRRKVTAKALAKYLGIPEDEIHQDDIPCIAMVGSGGGLRALVAGTGSLLAASEAGLFDCATYTAGVSGSCWLQTLFHSSLSGQRLDKLVDHLKARIGVHIAYPPVALATLNSAPTNKFLLSGLVEKLKGDPDASFGVVDLYGLLLAARLLVPRGEIGVDDRDLKISNQREYIKNGQHPMPIYTAVRHEIPITEGSSEIEKFTNTPSEETKERAKKEAWFQWLEVTPYELFCEEFGAGIPTWSMGRKFNNGKDLALNESGLYEPELRLTLLLGVFGSAFCATLSHYYKEVRPLLKGLVGFRGIDDMIEGRNDDLSKVHPIEPASIPNFAYGMEGKLLEMTPESVYKTKYLQLMDAGMSNNLPIYPLLRPGRDVDILIAFDASADIKTENWLAAVDGYARQRGIKGWPLGVGWPKPSQSFKKAAEELDEAEQSTAAEADLKLADAKAEQMERLKEEAEQSQGKRLRENQDEDPGDLGHCTIWVGTTQERSGPAEDVPSREVQEDWQLMDPDAGIAVIYFPFLSNPKVEGVDPVTSEYMSTWNFIYTPEEIDNVVKLARANFEEGQERTKRCVRAVYERKKKRREERENAERELTWRRNVRLGVVGKMGEGDHFHLT